MRFLDSIQRAAVLFASTLAIPAFTGPGVVAAETAVAEQAPAAQAKTSTPSEKKQEDNLDDGDSSVACETLLAALEPLCEQAQDAFAPPTEADLERSLDKVRQAASRLESVLRNDPDQKNAAQWRAYVEFDRLAEQIELPCHTATKKESEAREAKEKQAGEADDASPADSDESETRSGPDYDVLLQVFQKLSSGRRGLHLKPFRELRTDLRRYLSLVAAMEKPDRVRDDYRKIIDSLPEKVSDYVDDPSPRKAAVLSFQLGWLRDLGQADRLRLWIRERLACPNLFVEASEQFVTSGFERTVKDEPTSVADEILGTRISGSGKTTARVTARLRECPDAAHIEMEIDTTVVTDTVGRKGPARVYSDNDTHIQGAKSIFLGTAGARALPTASSGKMRSEIVGLHVNGGPLIHMIAWNRAQKESPQVSQIAALRAVQRMNRRVDRETDTMLAKAMARMRREVREPLELHGLLPSGMLIHSEPEHVEFVALEAGPNELGAPDSPPAITDEADLTVRIHQSALNSAAKTRFSGAFITSELVREAQARWGERACDCETSEGVAQHEQEGPRASESDGDTAETDEDQHARRDPPKPSERPWSVTLEHELPLFVTLDEDRLRVTIRGQEFEENGRKYDVGLDIVLTYRIEQDQPEAGAPLPGCVRLVLDGAPEVFPPDFESRPSRRLSGREQSARSIIQGRLEKALPADFEIPAEFVLPQAWGDVKSLRLVACRADGGWLTLQWCGARRRHPLIRLRAAAAIPP